MRTPTGKRPAKRTSWPRKLITGYLVATGIAVHVAVVGVLLLAPDLSDKVRQRLGAKAESLAPDWAKTPVVGWEEARMGLRRWQPALGDELAPGTIRVDGATVETLKQAAKALKAGSLLELGPGIHRTGILIKPDGVTIVGRGHVVFDNAAIKGKGAIIVQGNNATIRNIECRNISVRDRNGACVRLAGSDLTLDHVYFHTSQQGLLTGTKPGRVVIRDSFLERLGHGGRAHAIYQGGGSLEIDRSYILGSRGEGHEVKSRARSTTITNSVIASMTGNDSRLIDLANGGNAVITDNTLQQGPNSSNGDMIGFALAKKLYAENSVTLQRNLIILEREGTNRMLHIKATGVVADVRDNIIVASQPTGHGERNLEFENRQEAGLPAYPRVPDRSRL